MSPFLYMDMLQNIALLLLQQPCMVDFPRTWSFFQAQLKRVVRCEVLVDTRKSRSFGNTRRWIAHVWLRFWNIKHTTSSFRSSVLFLTLYTKLNYIVFVKRVIAAYNYSVYIIDEYLSQNNEKANWFTGLKIRIYTN